MNTVKRTERGWGGHFISCHQCLFRRNTLLESEAVSIVVSTVGNLLRLEGNKRIIDTLGYGGRLFETMAFEMDEGNEWKDGNFAKQVFFNSPWSLSVPDENLANDMHEAVVTELTEAMASGSRTVWANEGDSE